MSRNSAGSDDESTLWHDHTAAPYATSALYNASKGTGEYNDGDRQYPVWSARSSGNTFLTDNTSSSDWLRTSYAGGRDTAATATESLSPIPRVGEAAMVRGGRWGGTRQHYTDPQSVGGSYDYGGHRDRSDSGSKGIFGPSASRPLFTSFSSSLPRDRNVISGNTGCAAWTSSAGANAGEEAVGRYSYRWRSSVDTGGAFSPARWGQCSSDSVSLSSIRPSFTSTYAGTSSAAMSFNRQDDVGGGAGLSHADRRGARTTAGGAFGWGSDARDDSPAGLVNSRSRACVNRWTDEKPCGVLRSEGVSIWDDATTMVTGSSSILLGEQRQRSRRRRRHRRGSRHRRSGGGGSVEGNDSLHGRAYDDDDDGRLGSMWNDAETILCRLRAPSSVPWMHSRLSRRSFSAVYRRHRSYGIDTPVTASCCASCSVAASVSHVIGSSWTTTCRSSSCTTSMFVGKGHFSSTTQPASGQRSAFSAFA
ncbi:hypothetical_protein [Leishmania braziliensis MHOM/BR/75/M2904]|uniref:Hypothetical_protein n=1 Tax=Leishmania braziliensis MHOM/BR/75/M2904 TaxID=420245 RepID=A0A3P3ZG04_LEIBR|nr:hypothetical_protein [Leishmania braziliensis MHOM/BR/75/M2904]